MILQNTAQWLEAKQGKIGGSEIYSLVYHYCSKELIKIGVNLQTEYPFRTVQEMFLKVYFNAALDKIREADARFGKAVEPYIADRLAKEGGLSFLDVETTKDFIINQSMHELAACSPDGYLKPRQNQPFEIDDFDKKNKITHESGVGCLELKSANYSTNFSYEAGARLCYIFQLQYQMMVLNSSWGVLATIFPKENYKEHEFFKGEIVGILSDGYNESLYEKLNHHFNFFYYVYPKLPIYQAMIFQALDCFSRDLEKYKKGDANAFPKNSEDLAGLQREKRIWSRLWSESYGDYYLSELKIEDKQIDQLLDDRRQAILECNAANANKLKVENEVSQLVVRNGLDKYLRIIGTNQYLMFDRRGTLRVMPRRDNQVKNVNYFNEDNFNE